MRGCCVLLVEDNEVNRYLVRFVLEKGGLRVVTAENGRDAIELARRERPDLILMDIQMPVMDGYEATLQMKADADLRAIPVIALTAHAMPHERKQAVAAGCSGHIEKPIDTRTFVAQVSAFLPSAAAGD